MKSVEDTESLDIRVALTENAMASEFTRRYGEDLLYVHNWGKWLHWTGQRWKVENTLGAWALARKLTKELGATLVDPKLAARIESNATVNAIVSLARADRVHARVPEDFDADAWVLNTPAGTAELKFRELRAHRRNDCITKITPVSPSDVTAPHWAACLATWTNSDSELIAFLQRLCGYWLTGSVREEKLVIIYGPGGNGKTKFIETIRATMGEDYATGVAMETLMATTGEQHPTDLADLRGMRLAVAMETEEGRRLAESKIKHLTGGDRIRARHMRQDFFEFAPTHKIVIVGNHRPAIRNIDEAMRRRLVLIPFDVVIPLDARDPQLAEKLDGERPAVLRWMLDGAQAWQERGLDPPARVRAATEDYMESVDVFSRWLDERCVVGASQVITKSAAFEDWKQWAEASGEFVGTIRRLGERLRATPGVNEDRVGEERTKAWIGLGLR